jgi:nitric oxide reductase NorE protein
MQPSLANPLPVYHRRVTEPPGGLLVWLIVLLEAFTFCVGLVIFIAQSKTNAAVFQHGRESLNQTIALANTLILLTGGWCMANSLTRLRAGATQLARRWIGGAIFSALAFLLFKSVEYADKLAHGHGLHAGEFFTLYWSLTGFHFLHVATALVILVLMWRGLRRGRYTATQHEDVEGAGIFWHLCDFIWLLLYPIIYLLR